MNGVLVVLPWVLAAAFVVLCPLTLAIWGEDGPRNDDPPDPGGDSKRSRPGIVLAA